MLVMVQGCSPSKHYNLLSFFFDGVPTPEEAGPVQKRDTISVADSTLAANTAMVKEVNQMHTPYQDKQCNSCHDQSRMGKLIRLQPDLCYECHENFSQKFEVVHGPVGGGFCTTCHNPHMSVNNNLLIRKGQSLCLHCHESESLVDVQEHKGIDETSCTTCHDPHGGKDANFLKP